RNRALLAVSPLGDRAHAATVTQVREHRVPVHRDVVDLHTDPGLAHPLEDLTTPAVQDPYRVEVAHRVDPGPAGRYPQPGYVGQQFVVPRGQLGPPGLERGEG